MFRNAIVRCPSGNFADGLTTAALGLPDYHEALLQHARYCEALKECGCTITALEADPRYPDSTFVEDTAVLASGCAVLTRPGAPSRLGETAAIREILRGFFPALLEIEPPGTLDGGDICEAEDHLFIGISHRTNEEGARQLAAYLARAGYTSSLIDIRDMTSILHLKSGISHIGGNTLVAIEEMAEKPEFRKYELIRVPLEESYAANCVRVNETVLVAAGYPHFTAQLLDRGFKPLALEMSEFQKMDGGLSCLSLRF